MFLAGCPSPPTVNTSNTPPTVTIVDPEANPDGTASIIDTTQPQTLACRVFDLETLPEDLEVLWTILPQDGSGIVEEIGSPQPDSDGTTTLTWNLAERDGAGLLEVEVIDEGLLTARASLEVWFQGEDLAPAVEILSPTDGASYPEETLVEFSAVVTDDRGTEGLSADWQSSLDGLIETTTVESSGVTQFSSDGLSPGFHSITVEVRDSGGQYASDQIGLEIVPPDLPPTAPEVDIQPDPPGTNDDLTCLIVLASSDPEGDPVDYEFDWFRDGEIALSGTNTAPAALTLPDEEWRCVVTPSDRSGNVGPSAEDTVTIGNSEPTMGGVDLRPFDLYETTVLECLPYGYFDPDGDPEGWTYAWFVNSEEVVGATGSTLDGTSFDEGDAVSCSANPFDGYVTGVGEDSDVLTVRNSPPGVPGISLTPAVPTRFESILCSVAVAAVDPDPGDIVNYEFSWRRDGAETGLTDPLLPSSETELGQTWTCSARLGCAPSSR